MTMLDSLTEDRVEYRYIAHFVHKDLDFNRTTFKELFALPIHVLDSEHLAVGSDYIGARIYDLKTKKLVAIATKEGPVRLKWRD